MMIVKAVSASSADKVSPVASFPSVAFKSCDIRALVSGGASGRVGPPRDGEEIGQNTVAMLAGDAFRMELNAMDWQIAMMHRHDQPVLSPGSGNQNGRQLVTRDDQAVIAG